MATPEKIYKAGIPRQPGWLYYISKYIGASGKKREAVMRTKMVRGGMKKGKEKPEVVLFVDIIREDGFLYYLDKDGDVSRSVMGKANPRDFLNNAKPPKAKPPKKAAKKPAKSPSPKAAKKVEPAKPVKEKPFKRTVEITSRWGGGKLTLVQQLDRYGYYFSKIAGTEILHQEDGPAHSYGGSKFYYAFGKKHREDGPAEDTPTLKTWRVWGTLHRTEGPAYETWSSGKYVNGQYYIAGSFHSKAQFDKLSKDKDFIQTVENFMWGQTGKPAPYGQVDAKPKSELRRAYEAALNEQDAGKLGSEREQIESFVDGFTGKYEWNNIKNELETTKKANEGNEVNAALWKKDYLQADETNRKLLKELNLALKPPQDKPQSLPEPIPPPTPPKASAPNLGLLAAAGCLVAAGAWAGGKAHLKLEQAQAAEVRV